MSDQLLITAERIEKNIYTVRGIEVMLDSDLANIYNVETKRINEAVKRNPKKFPDDLMFQLTQEEFDNLRSQIATTNFTMTRILPKVFTEQGIYMLATVLKSDKATDVTLSIMRTFTKLRRYAMEHQNLAIQIKALKDELKEEFTQEMMKTKSWTKDRLSAVADSIIILEESITELQDVFSDFKSANEVEKIGFERDK
ncbi:ORF6N domain-containing protein [Sulfurospirillum multivorans]|uniref:DNA-binding domain-containing protein n=2 Tax=Sulfurospirillum multivorans TaxID=66821 RepID=A0AA86DXA4_SULMK|nr:ORF6N domain-containing protein [Sulfurospirillum multivorans]AHJ11813.1 DNA-binding domain-containing protein [Sulfurospirillum multivorans DSM 12446]QEH05319.1 DNA-binding domain-containing protein [Sulfurospirillum multivorans]